MNWSGSNYGKDFRDWSIYYRAALILIFLIFLGRLFDLQIIRGSYFRELADENRIREITIEAKRGDIIASGGELIAGSREVVKKIHFDQESGYKKLAGIEKGYEISEWERNYPEREVFSHVVGYLGEVNVDEVGKIEPQCMEKGPNILGALVGRGGLEESYNCRLKGINGAELIEVDSSGAIIRNLGSRKPVSGENVKTTLIYGLQKKADELFAGKRGAVVATDLDGKLLVLYSSPGYDPNDFVELNDPAISTYLSDKNLPLLNRAISGRFHPGSIFKPIVATAALEEEVIDQNYRYVDTGSIKIDSLYGNYSFSNWYYLQYGGTEGEIDLTKALARSTDTFFYEVGGITGIDTLYNYSANKFGLINKTGVDIPGEIEGLIPDPEWKEAVKKERWFLGDTYNFSIGQGDISITPISINRAIAAVAANGTICRPHLVEDQDSKYCESMNLKKESLELVKEGMVKACSTGGTGYTFFDFFEKTGVKVACKTGTAQNVSEDPHSWFTVFAPYEDPKIVMTILVENGGEGSKVAGPIARDLMNFWVTNSGR